MKVTIIANVRTPATLAAARILHRLLFTHTVDLESRIANWHDDADTPASALRGGGTWCAYFNSMKCEDALSAGVETNRAMSSTTPSTAPPLAARPHTALTHLVASHPSPICHTPPELFNCAHSTRVCGFHTCQLRSLALAERAPLRDAGLFHRANGFLRLRLAHSLIHSLTYPLTHSLVLTYSLTHSLTHSHTLSLTAS